MEFSAWAGRSPWSPDVWTRIMLLYRRRSRLRRYAHQLGRRLTRWGNYL